VSRAIGAALPHESALRHVTGDAVYIDDMPMPPGALHGVPLASLHAHARILRRDASKACAVPGVHAVLFADDIPGENQMGPVIHDEPLLATDQVFAVGQLVAVVFAETRAAALRALALVEVDYEPLSAVVDLDQAIANEQFFGETHRIERGRVDAQLQAAPHRLTGELRAGGQEHFYLETHASVALPGEDRALTVYSSTQHPSETQALVAHVLGWPIHRVVVVCPRMGGGFGGKETQASHWACLAALGAYVTGRPAKLWLDRDQDMSLTGGRHPLLARYDVGYADDGRILAYDAKIFVDGGWASDLSLAILDRALFHADNAYALEHVRLVGEAVRTNKVSNCAFRGFGGPQGMLVIEQVMERIAIATGLDPLQVRRRNFYADDTGSRTPYDQQVEDFRLGWMVDDLAARAELSARQQQVAAFNQANPHTKRGISLTPVKFGISFTASFLNQAGALVVIYPDGSVQLNHGGTEMGQGLYTKMMAVCAHALGLPIGSIRPMPTATDKVPNTSATAASSGADLNGAAVRAACLTLASRLVPVAAQKLGVPEDDPRLRTAIEGDGDGPGWAWLKDGPSVSFAEVCSAAYFQQISLSAAGFYRTPGIGYDRAAGKGRPFLYFAYGAACSEVELCTLTGEWRLLRVDILHDVGDSLAPDLDRGQVEGAFTQGLGWLTLEELVYAADGRLLTHGPSTYKIPAVGDLPEHFNVRLVERHPQPGVIYGSKAVGEPPFPLAISVHTALQHAVAACGAPVPLAVPATHEALLDACERAAGR